jgi:hypothetical protein
MHVTILFLKKSHGNVWGLLLVFYKVNPCYKFYRLNMQVVHIISTKYYMSSLTDSYVIQLISNLLM